MFLCQERKYKEEKEKCQVLGQKDSFPAWNATERPLLYALLRAQKIGELPNAHSAMLHTDALPTDSRRQ